MNEHQTKTRWSGQGYRAECACGWKGPYTNYATAAMLDGHDHSRREQGPRSQRDELMSDVDAAVSAGKALLSRLGRDKE